jgi:long-chain fatty acid transport protein
MYVTRYFAVAVTLLLSVVSQSSYANVGDAFGFGSRTSALAGAGAAWGSGAFAAYHNPAAISAEADKRLKFGFGLVLAYPNFLPINNVVTQNKYVADGVQYGDVDTSYQSTFGQVLGISYRLFPDFFDLSLGFVAFLPLNQAAYMDTGEPFIPEYFLYRARTQRPQTEFGLGMNLGHGFRVGAGLHMAFTLTGNATVFLNTKPDTTTSSMRFTSSLKPKLAPYFGLLFKPEDDPRTYSIGAVFRLPAASDNTLQLKSAARAFGPLAAVDFNFAAFSTLFYDPMALELGGSLATSSWSRMFLQLDYQIWSKFQAPALDIQQPQGSIQITPSSLPKFSYRNIWVPRIGEEFYLSDRVTLRAGYAYRPSILADVPTGAGNYLDPPKHMLNLGLGLNYAQFFGFDIPCNIDLNFTYHYLQRQLIQKTAGNEVGDLSDNKIGYPEYTAGGNVIGGGVSLSLAF